MPLHDPTLIEVLILIIIFTPTIYAMLRGAPFVPTEMAQVERMLKAAQLKPGMILYDLGSGDGRLVHTASKKYGAQSIGYEFSPLVWLWSKFLSLFWRSKAKLRFGNFWSKDFSDADVLVCYLLTHSMQKLKKEIWPQLKPGALVISNAFIMEDLKTWKKVPRDTVQKLGSIWIYKKAGSVEKAPLKGHKKRMGLS